MAINYFICFVSIWAFHQILDTGGLFTNFTTPAFTQDDSDTKEDDEEVNKITDKNHDINNNVLRIGDGKDIERDLIRKDTERLKIIDETMSYAKLRLLKNIYFCNNSIYTCLINVDCREATDEEKDYLLGILQSSSSSAHEDDYDDDDNDNDNNDNQIIVL